jgi:hypothetical protein
MVSPDCQPILPDKPHNPCENVGSFLAQQAETKDSTG